MPRLARLDARPHRPHPLVFDPELRPKGARYGGQAPEVVHPYVIIRGIERRKIFRDNIDRNDLVARLSKILPEAKMLSIRWHGGHPVTTFRTPR